MSEHEDLTALTARSDRFVTITIPTPSNLDHPGDRFGVEWKNARRHLNDVWSEDELAPLDGLVHGLRHDAGASLVLVAGRGGPTFVEVLDEPVTGTTVHEGPLPRWATVIEARQRVIPHVVVEADRAGADLTAFDGGTVLETDSIDGATEHIHRGHPGGWSQRRFQQRAENVWEANARLVSDAVAHLARRVDAQLIAISGDVRAQTLVIDSLPADLADRAVKIEAGSPAGIADEIVKLLSTLVSERVVAAADRVRSGMPSGLASIDADEIIDALGQGRVDMLLVHDDGSDDHTDSPDSGRLVDRAIVAALQTDAEILVVPKLAMLDGPLAALMRWELQP
jgi:hypothetical protein